MRQTDLEYKLYQAITEVNDGLRRHRLIIITSCQIIEADQARNIGATYINLNLKLSEKLMNIPYGKRSRAVSNAVNEILTAYAKDQVLLLNYIELLFLPELQQDPVRLFEELSRDRTLVLLWPGFCENGVLSYAQPWHSEYREFVNPDAMII